MEYFVHLGADSVDAIKQACGTEVEELNVTENGTYNAPSGKAYNPVTVNVESGGGGFEKVTITNHYGATIYIVGLTEDGGIETEIADNDSAEIICGKVSMGGMTAIPVPLLISTKTVMHFTPANWDIDPTSVGVFHVAFALETVDEPGIRCFAYVICQPDANIIVLENNPL